MRKWYLLLTLILTLAMASSASANSLWSSKSNLYSDQKAREIGDLVTMIIVERTQATQSAATSIGKDAEIGIGPGAGLLSGYIPLIKAGGGDEMSAKGSTTRGGELNAKITTQIIDKMPNGNLILEGRQTILINGEEQEIIVSGVVRPNDITSNNTVLSTYVADAHISFRGNGSLANKQEPGLLTRIFSWIF